MAQTTIHQGHQSTISPTTSSPGLLFLAHLLPALDSLAPDPEARLAASGLLGTNASAQFATNGHAPNQLAQGVGAQLARRAERLARFERELHVAWDVDLGAGSGRRTVLYESTSTTVFKGDPAAREAKVREFSVLELRTRDGVVGGDGSSSAEDWEVVELRTVMDPSPVTLLAQAIINSNK